MFPKSIPFYCDSQVLYLSTHNRNKTQKEEDREGKEERLRMQEIKRENQQVERLPLLRDLQDQLCLLQTV